MSQPSESGVKRRDFLKILGGAGATTALIGCETAKVEHLVPYLVSPDNTVPGVSNYYATVCRECSTGCGILAETRDGRVIKLEGAANDPLSRGAICGVGQAALQGLYNPDRYRGPMLRQNGALQPATWDDALKLLSQKLAEARTAGSAGRAVFINQHENSSFPAFLDQWLAAFGMPAHLSYDGQADHAAIAAHRQVHSVAWPKLDFGAAKLIVSFGADFLDGWGASVPQQLDWADARGKLVDAPRFVYVGPRRSLTGLNADEWIDCKPGGELAIVRAISGAGTVEAAATASGVNADRLTRLVNEAKAAKPSLYIAGGSASNGYDLALAVAELNKSTGNVGVTVKPAESVLGFEGIATTGDVAEAASRMNAGQVPIVFVRGANPVFTMPKSSQFAEAFAKVPFKVSFSSYPDETAQASDLVLPDHHSLEQWGDAQLSRGSVALQQPVMDPVFDSRATSDVLIAVAKADTSAASKYPAKDYRAWLISRFPGGAVGLEKALETGTGSATILERAARPRAGTAGAAAKGIEETEGDFYLVVYPSPVLGDGRGANKPWLQELPDPVTKIAWQSWIEIHPLAAQRMGVEPGDHITVTTGAGTITAPAFLYLGVRQDTVAVAIGRGHTAYGRYAQNIGVNPLDALPGAVTAVGSLPLVSTKARVAKAGPHSLLVSTEGSARQHGRGIARAVLASELASGAPLSPVEEAMPGDASHEFLPGLKAPIAQDAQGELGDPQHNQKGMYADDHWSGMNKRRWAMTVDLARCTGCSACMTACYAENNIPTVGAPFQGAPIMPDRTGPGANILRSREMNWIRLERYFEGGEDGSANFEARFVPMMCQHCGNAPCEPVCPVFATYHSPDGLNAMIYNRCVGTRYCSNNCPYKVRYFNWFGYGEPARPQYAFPEPLNWQLNPDVTVRGKGVMEKCSFCVQRIREAEHRARLESREVEPDEFTTACAQACPSRAIVWGDAADQRWTVAKKVGDRRGYHVFEELNTFTAVVYLQKVNHAAPGAPTGAARG